MIKTRKILNELLCETGEGKLKTAFVMAKPLLFTIDDT